jgi:hypothetical protein
MTTPTVQNTVFIVITPARCETGADILHRRAQAVKIATIETWWQAEGQGWLEYVRHYIKCAQCQEYELAKRGERWAVIEAEETK